MKIFLKALNEYLLSQLGYTLFEGSQKNSRKKELAGSMLAGRQLD